MNDATPAKKSTVSPVQWPLLIAALVVTAGATLATAYSLVPKWVEPVDAAKRATMLTGQIVIAATLVGLVPLAIVARIGRSKVLAGWLVGSMLRMFACLAAAIVLVKVNGMPALAVLGTLTVMYLPLLAVEAAVVVKGLSRTND